jgi:hypothetical protein
MFGPNKATGLAIGAGVLVAALLADAVAVAFLTSQPVSLLTFVWVCVLAVSGPLFLWFGYRTWGLAGARYTLTSDALTVVWGSRREVIPLPHIEELHPAVEFEGELAPRGWHWPGCIVSRIDHEQLGAVEFLVTTAERAGWVLLGYSGGWLVLSPSEPAAFIAAVKERSAVPVTDDAPVEELARRALPQSVVPEVTRWPVWSDRLALGLMGAGGLGVLALVGYLASVFAQLPPVIALSFNNQGVPARFGTPTGLFILPMIGAVAWALNSLVSLWLHRREGQRPLVYLLLASTLFVVGLVWVAAFGLLTAGG